MNENNNLLSPDSSPQKLTTAGVRRVNNMPLFIAIGVLTVFVVLIALVAQKRANAQNQITEPAKLKTAKKNTMNLAYEVVGDHKSGMIAANSAVKANPLEPSLPMPVPQQPTVKLETEDQAIPDNEIERIRQEKTQAFEEAVKAKTSIMVENARLNGKDNTVGNDVNGANSFKEQLQSLQGMQKSMPMPQTLGGIEDESRWHLNSKLENPNSRYELRAGGVIPGVMVSGISSELPGQIIGQVSQNVYDTATGRYLLIPQGTKLIGIYSSDVSFGQDSVLIAWQRLVFPDGKALDIGSMPGADSAGYGGFRDQVNHHYARIYGSALLMSGIVAGITYSQNANQSNQIGYNQPTAGNVLSEALGQQLGEVTSQLVSKNLNVSPTIHVRPGYRFNVIVVKDLTFKQPYRSFAYS
ncbi:TrbI/VirB10 family protein [Legionella spiritensis]|uniref:Conjugal transfer protein TrbI n=1 Tax=Legionella spiritensis TaxID=452 RepID=A0A0W0Z5K0_LEGSP|nr:TrbI/VirB10 family protein [Legionella spiritensis]KTD64439.1 conjugal transfer protein TrbI [Legionella spiritensis]SNV45856.1 trbI Conjugal transfer protein trbI [Legionella spiritensis]